MLRVLAGSWALFLGICLLMIGNSLQGTLLGVRGKIEGFDPQVMGYVMTCYFAGFFGGSLMTPNLIRRVGYVRVFAALGSLISAAFIIYAVWVSPIAWGLMRFVVGFCFSGVYVVAESWLNNTATNENRGQTLSAYSIVQMFGVVAGQMLINVADPGGYTLFIIMSVVVSVAFAPILLSTSPAPMSDNASPMSLRELLAASPLGCIGSFLLGGIFGAIFGMGAVYGGEVGLSIEQISLFMTLLYAPALFAQYPIGWLSDRIDRRRLIVGCTIVASLACALGTYAVGGSIILYLTAAILGAVVNPLYSLFIAYTNDYLQPEKMAAASSGLVFMNGLGAAAGPITVGYFMGWFGPPGFFLFMGILSTAIAIYALYRMTRRAAPAPEETGTFVQLPTRGAVMVEMATEIYADEALEDDAKVIETEGNR